MGKIPVVLLLLRGNIPTRVRFDVHHGVFTELMGEVFSPLNLYAAQRRFSVHEPTLVQLTWNYIEAGGFQRFLERHPVDGEVLSC